MLEPWEMPETEAMTAPTERLENTVDPKLLEILVCPLTKGPLEFDAAKQELVMLPEEARKIE